MRENVKQLDLSKCRLLRDRFIILSKVSSLGFAKRDFTMRLINVPKEKRIKYMSVLKSFYMMLYGIVTYVIHIARCDEII